MADNLQLLPFPLKGLDEYRPYSDGNPAETTQSASNVRGVDPRSGRARGGMRSGLSKYVAGQVVGNYSVQHINHLVTTDQLPSSGVGQFVAARASAAIRFGLSDSAGSSYYTNGTSSNHRLGNSCWDESNNAYIAEYNVSVSGFVLWKVSSGGALAWSVTPGIAIDIAVKSVTGMVVIGSYVYVSVAETATVGKIYRFATSDGTLDGGTAWKTADSLAAFRFSQNSKNNLAKIGTKLIVCNANAGSQRVTIWETTTGTQLTATALTLGLSDNLDCCSDGVAFFYLVGVAAGRIARISQGGVIDWNIAPAYTPTAGCWDPIGGRLVVSCTTSPSLKTLNPATGATVATADPGAVTSWACVRTDNAGNFYLFRSNATNDVMKVDSALATSWGPQTVSATSDHTGASVNQGSGSASSPYSPSRQVRLLAVNNGTVTRLSGSSWGAVTGGSNILSSASVLFSSQSGLDLYFADGALYYFYDSSIDSVVAWTASAGSLPTDSFGLRARLIETWRGRIVLSGLLHDPQNWFMSAVNAPNNWDYAPATTVVTQAVAGNNSTVGLVGDIINGMIPFSDDVLLFLGDHTIWQMTGDPMAGGQIDLVSDTIGGAFGRAWCKSPSGEIYFVGSRGGVYRMVPSAVPEKITSRSIDERMATIDFSLTSARLAWDDRQQGLHVFLSPYNSASTTTHFWFDARNQAWWADSFGNTNHNPLAVHVFDGDAPSDRVVLLGGRDGYVRKVDSSASDDDGTSITSSIFLGPITNSLLKEIQLTLGSTSGSITWSTHVGQTAEAALVASALATGTFAAGRNRSVWPRSYGNYTYLKLTSTNAWALEQILIRTVQASAVRQRIY